MLLGTKKVAMSGLLAAVTVALMILSSVVESSSLFFIAAASFCVGIVLRECGQIFGVGFWIACIVLNLLLAPNKFYVITFAAMGLYILLTEWLFEKIANAKEMKSRKFKFFVGKYVVFNLIYIPFILFAPKILVAKQVKGMLLLVVLAFGQVALFVYDFAYRYFQENIWSKARKKLLSFYRN